MEDISLVGRAEDLVRRAKVERCVVRVFLFLGAFLDKLLLSVVTGDLADALD